MAVGVTAWDVATDQTGAASDAAAKGAPATPFIFALLFAVFFVLGRALLAAGRPSYGKAVRLTAVVALLLVAIPAIVSIVYSGDSLLEVSTYLPWAIGFGALPAILLPGSLVQAFLLVSRHNITGARP
ncbi:MAG: hypothetical protein KF790_12935 [Steroidobacteraceae bacterium]|nr:hypothetical protein [Steroidobacteraceae bacterium]MCW5573002.1 hypothetical protein [Steroidobacteraceae bacterium]